MWSARSSLSTRKRVRFWRTRWLTLEFVSRQRKRPAVSPLRECMNWSDGCQVRGPVVGVDGPRAGRSAHCLMLCNTRPHSLLLCHAWCVMRCAALGWGRSEMHFFPTDPGSWMNDSNEFFGSFEAASMPVVAPWKAGSWKCCTRFGDKGWYVRVTCGGGCGVRVGPPCLSSLMWSSSHARLCCNPTTGNTPCT